MPEVLRNRHVYLVRGSLYGKRNEKVTCYTYLRNSLPVRNIYPENHLRHQSLKLVSFRDVLRVSYLFMILIFFTGLSLSF